MEAVGYKMEMIELIWGVEYHHFETVKNLERQRDDFKNMLDIVLDEKEQLRKERDELASALNEYYIMYGDRSIISRVDDLLEKAGILND